MDSSLYIPFVQGSQNIIRQMAGVQVEFDEKADVGGQEISSLGVTSIVTFAGVRRGRLLIDMEPELALYMTNTIIGSEFDNAREYDVLTTISELNNIIAGDAITKLNNEFDLSLRLAPPIVLCGDQPIISVPKLTSVTINGRSDYGNIKINIAFAKEG